MTDQVTTNPMFSDTPTEPQKPADQQTAAPIDQSGARTPTVDINDVLKDQLSSITNDTGEPKYKDVLTALNALKYSQEHIQTLQEENAQMREQVQRAASLDDVLTQLTTETKGQAQTDKAQMNVEDIRGVTLETLRQYEAEKIAIANQKEVVQKLKEKYGSVEEAERMYALKAQELGLDVNTFNAIAARSPKAVVSYFTDDFKSTPPKNIQGTVNSAALGRSEEFNTGYKHKNIMYGASSKEILEAWHAAGDTVKKELMEINK